MAEAVEVTEAGVLAALGRVQDPELGGDVVSRKMIREIKICDGNVAFEVAYPTPGSPTRRLVEEACKAAVQAVPGVTLVNVRSTVDVPRGAAGPGAELVPGVRHII